MRNGRYTVSLSPHIRNGRTLRSMIMTTMAALAPAALWGIYQFGVSAAVLIFVSMAAAVVTEAAVAKLSGKPESISDGHAALVGLTLVLLVPAGAPWWIVIIGACLAIVIGKMTFGPLGGAPLSPALVGLLIITMSWPKEVATHVQPRTAPAELKAEDAAPAESPVEAVLIDPSDDAEYELSDLFLGRQAGPIGAASPLLVLLGGLFLIWRRAARWQAPIGFIIGLGVSAGIAHAVSPGAHASAAFHLFTGAAMFGAFFLCTEWTSTPVTPSGLFLFGLLAGGLAWLLRISGLSFGSEPWAITIISLATPLLDRIAPTPFGKVVSHA